MDTKPLESLKYNPPIPNPNITFIESIQARITGINEDLRAIYGESDELIIAKMDALEAIEIFDKVDICNLLAAVKKGRTANPDSGHSGSLTS